MVLPLAIFAAYRNVSSRCLQLDAMARLYLEHCSTFLLLTPSCQGQKTEEAHSLLRGLLPNWKVAPVTFREKHPGMLLVPSPEPTGVPEAGYRSPAGLQHLASPVEFLLPFVLPLLSFICKRHWHTSLRNLLFLLLTSKYPVSFRGDMSEPWLYSEPARPHSTVLAESSIPA